MQIPLQLSGNYFSELDNNLHINSNLLTKRVSIGLTVNRKTAKKFNRKNWQILTVSRKKFVWWKQWKGVNVNWPKF